MIAGDFSELGIATRPNGPAEQRVACPRCDRGRADDALGVNIESGLYHCFRCGWSGRAGTGETHSTGSVVRLDDPRRAERVCERLREVWKASVPITDVSARPVREYLASRGLQTILSAPPTCLRAHASLKYFDTAARRELGTWPAMLALFSDRRGEPCTVHATYLRHDGGGKAPVGSPKKILGIAKRGATRGGAVRLHELEGGRLGLAEGIESALSLHLIRRVPVWSAFCADNLAAVRLPASLTELEIGVDVDGNGTGERAARALASRILEERPSIRVRLIIPEGDGPRDLNDELRSRVR